MVSKKKRAVLEKLGSAMDMPPDALDIGTGLWVTGGRYAKVEGFRSVSSYDEGCIGLICKDIKIFIKGMELRIKNMGLTTITIEGIIAAVEFSDLE